MEFAIEKLDQSQAFEPKLRAGEKSGCFFRSDRLIKVNDEFYFATREGIDIGPFPTKALAQQGLDRFIYAIQKKIAFERAKVMAFGSTWAVTNFK